MDSQTVCDLLALSIPDDVLIAAFEQHRQWFEENGDVKHQHIMELLVQAIDNTYGEDAFNTYENCGVLPRQQ